MPGFATILSLHSNHKLITFFIYKGISSIHNCVIFNLKLHFNA
nr:MAG TPA: hypothetical protein [Caudoviricetes sp.]